MTRIPVLMCWSSGKDSAMALHQLQQSPQYQVVGLLTTITREYGRVSMHGVRRSLVEAQARSIGLPLEVVYFPAGGSLQDYEEAMRQALDRQRQAGVNTVAFGDLFLEDLRKQREDKLAQAGFKALFPLWKHNTHQLARQMLALGFRTVLTCVDTQALDGKFTGCDWDEQLLSQLPAQVDPCGENGEFHSFCYAGPIFREPISFTRGPVVLRDGRFSYGDLLPV